MYLFWTAGARLIDCRRFECCSFLWFTRWEVDLLWEIWCLILKPTPLWDTSRFATTARIAGPSSSLTLVRHEIGMLGNKNKKDLSLLMCMLPSLHRSSGSFGFLARGWIEKSFVLATGDYTPVCTTELGKIASYNPEFEKRGVKLLGLSTDSVEDHQGWIKDIESYTVTMKTYGVNTRCAICTHQKVYVSVVPHDQRFWLSLCCCLIEYTW